MTLKGTVFAPLASLLLASVFAAPSLAAGAPAAPLKAVIQKLYDARDSAENRGDTAGTFATYDPAFINTDQTGKRERLPDYESYKTSFRAQSKTFKLRSTVTGVTLRGGAAVATISESLTASATDPDDSTQTQTASGTVIDRDTWRKTASGWREVASVTVTDSIKMTTRPSKPSAEAASMTIALLADAGRPAPSSKAALQKIYGARDAAAERSDTAGMFASYDPAFVNTDKDGKRDRLPALKRNATRFRRMSKTFKAISTVRSVTLQGDLAVAKVHGSLTAVIVDPDDASQKATLGDDETDRDSWRKTAAGWREFKSQTLSHTASFNGHKLPNS